MDVVDVAVVGGGIVGLAIARELSLARSVVLLEAESRLGIHASSRSSEVIHAGIYYEPGSLKAELCVQGRDALYDYCRQAGVAHRRVGKLIVATSYDELGVVEALAERARHNGVSDLEMLTAAGVQRLEPELHSVGGLWSPMTGIVDSHALLSAFRRDAQARGATVAQRTPLLRSKLSATGLELELGGAEPLQLGARVLVNAAGAKASEVARCIEGLPLSLVPKTTLAKGHYFHLTGKAPFRHLVYPVPSAGGLGIHLTLDLAGSARFGPDVLWVEDIDYSFDETRRDAFVGAIARYYPSLDPCRLTPGFTGIRAKVLAPGQDSGDFVIQAPRPGVPVVNLFGIDSPGLTASLAIARRVSAMLDQCLGT